MPRSSLLVAGAGTVAVAVALSGWWVAAVLVLFIATWLGLVWFAVVKLLGTKFGVEKSFQSMLAVFWRVPAGMLWVGFVLAGGHRWGLPGQVLAAAAGDRTQLVFIIFKVGVTLIGGTWLPLWTMSKGSRL